MPLFTSWQPDLKNYSSTPIWWLVVAPQHAALESRCVSAACPEAMETSKINYAPLDRDQDTEARSVALEILIIRNFNALHALHSRRCER
jgi:hypothetical protein